MKTTPVAKEDLLRSVIAVPPMARNADFSLNKDANRALMRYLESGGVRTLMYGGNANFYHIALSEYAATLDFLAEAAGADTWVLPSIGPDYGKAMDQAAIIKASAYPTAMLLPISFPFTDGGLAVGIRRITDKMGKPAVVYIKSEPYIQPDTLAALVEEGRVASVKYAVVRNDPTKDDYLSALCAAIDRKYLVSGIGETPAIIHLRDFGITSFTSGSVCLAPAGSMKLLSLLKEKKYEEAEKVRAVYMPFEASRDGISPIRVLHDGVTLAGIADMGPMLPMTSGLSEAERAKVLPVAKALAAANAAFMPAKAAA
ncbi:MAG: dihydrodipicolinate synthase family protein [Betaproteobacteria bacterium]|nr:dihydrodipicolinate synthase family protein [Betaproteobacteria bacterium]